MIAYEYHNSASRGVIILQNRKFPFLIEKKKKTGVNVNGRITYAAGSWNNQKIVFFSVYSPNKYEASFIFRLSPSKYLIQFVNSFNILPLLISDHSALICNLSLPIRSQSIKRWRLNTTLLSNENFICQVRSDLTIFIKENTDPSIN